eukprot:SAG22_NODE_1829_length_3484_cov_2.530576_1_plen_67_part_00
MIAACHSLPNAVAWGYLDAAAPVKLRVPDGATVRVDTVNGGPEVLPHEQPLAGQVFRDSTLGNDKL